jgi:hypothetical protein
VRFRFVRLPALSQFGQDTAQVTQGAFSLQAEMPFGIE